MEPGANATAWAPDGPSARTTSTKGRRRRRPRTACACASMTGCMSKQYELKVPTKTSDRMGAKVTEVDRKTHKNE